MKKKSITKEADQNKRHHRSKLFWITTMIIIVLSFVRIFAATTIDGFNYDETRRAETVADVLDGGDFKKTTYKFAGIPIFVRTDAGFSSLPFLAPATAWSFFFGTSHVSLRVFVAVIVTLALILLARTISLWAKKANRPKVFLLASIIALTLPWLFFQGLLFWDTSLAPVFFILAFYAFTKIKNAEKPKLFHQLLLPLSLITSVYLYLPSAIPAVVLYFTAIFYLGKNKTLNMRQIIINLLVSVVAVIPFVVFFLTFPDGNTRTGELSIFSGNDPLTAIGLFFRNLALLFSPYFLFLVGDQSRHHSVGYLGMLGPLYIIPIAYTIYAAIKKLFTKNEKLLIIISALGIISATVSSALTNPDSQPHSLRSNAAVPFYIALITLGAAKLLERFPKLVVPAYVLIALSILAYFASFFFLYPPIADEWFTYK